MIDDSYHERAKDAMRAHFVNAKGDPIRTPYYQSQLQVLYESEFFPWIVADALKDLVEEGCLEVFTAGDIPGSSKLEYLLSIKFFANKNALATSRDKELMKRHMLSVAKVVNEYCDPSNSKMLGNQLESLVWYELRAQNFEIIGTNTNELNGKKWTETKHDLDIIARKKDTKFTIGVEVKNTLSVMPRDEIYTKINICNTLGITPVFACRWIKPHMEYIRQKKGFSWVFKTQIYPFGTEEFTRKLYEKLSQRTKNGRGFPISSNGKLPDKSVSRFVQWVRTVEKSSPQ